MKTLKLTEQEINILKIALRSLANQAIADEPHISFSEEFTSVRNKLN